MRADELRAEGRRLGRLVLGLGRQARNTPVPREVRARIVLFAARARAAGWTRPRVARAVGVSVGSLRNWWAVREAAAPALVPIVVTVSPVARAPLTIVAPSGYRVEGLDVPTTAALLRALA